MHGRESLGTRLIMVLGLLFVLVVLISLVLRSVYCILHNDMVYIGVLN